MMKLAGQNVLILGLGDSGLSIAQWCARAGAKVRVWDTRAAPPQAASLAETVPSAIRLDGALTAQALDEIAVIFKSPGLAPHDPRIASLVTEAAAKGIPIQGELQLFIDALAALKASQNYAPKILAITGTNGKTTTTALTAKLVQSSGKTVAMAGNIGPTLLGTLLLHIDNLPEVWVLELSSFQLHDVENFNPTAATILNITQDHLDWHGRTEAYVSDKLRIFGVDSVTVVNRDEAIKLPQHCKQISFGLDAPRKDSDFGLVNEANSNTAWLACLANNNPQRLLPANALRIRGRHNAANALAALALASTIGCPMPQMLAALRDYAGEPHRVQLIGVVNGVEFYDDSKGTNVSATVAALEGLGAEKLPGKLLLILGGDGKGQDFSPLTAPLARYARAIATIGRDAAAIEVIISGVTYTRAQTLEQATAWCFAQAKAGDAVLLSPACASLDMFRNYAHRAEVFAQAMQTIANDCGQL